MEKKKKNVITITFIIIIATIVYYSEKYYSEKKYFFFYFNSLKTDISFDFGGDNKIKLRQIIYGSYGYISHPTSVCDAKNIFFGFLFISNFRELTNEKYFAHILKLAQDFSLLSEPGYINLIDFIDFLSGLTNDKKKLEKISDYYDDLLCYLRGLNEIKINNKNAMIKNLELYKKYLELRRNDI